MMLDIEQVKKSSLTERRIWLLDHVRTQIMQILKLDLEGTVNFHGSFDDDIPWWIDSFLLLKLTDNLQSSLGCSLPTTIVFEYSTIGALVDYLEQAIFSRSRSTLQSSENSAFSNQVVTSELIELSDSEAETLLIRQLNSTRD